MQKMMEWLEEEAKGVLPILGYIVLSALVIVSLDRVVATALINWSLIEGPPLPKAGDPPFEYYNALQFAELFFLGPLVEEVVFRVLPFAIIIAFVTKSPKFVFGAVIFFALLFGAGHSGGILRMSQTAIAGFFFGLVFLKCGGLQKSFLKASASTIASHGFTNLFIVLQELWRYFALK